MCKGPEVEKEVGHEIQETAQSWLKCLPGLVKDLGFYSNWNQKPAEGFEQKSQDH